MRWEREALARLRGRISTRLEFSVRTAVEALRHNKLRASLTSLGILFGVASVIAMLAIGKGAEREILEQMRLLGSNNVMITPLVEQHEGPADDQPEKKVTKFSPGLTYADAQAIARVVPGVEVTSRSADTRCAELRSISTPAAVFGALAESTRAVQPVDVSPSIARRGSPKLPAGWPEGL